MMFIISKHDKQRAYNESPVTSRNMAFMSVTKSITCLAFLCAVSLQLATTRLQKVDAVQHFQANNDKLASDVTSRQKFATEDESEGGLGCDLCKVIVSLLQTFVEGNRTAAEIAVLSDDICNILHVEDKTVCKAIVNEFKVFYDYLILYKT